MNRALPIPCYYWQCIDLKNLEFFSELQAFFCRFTSAFSAATIEVGIVARLGTSTPRTASSVAPRSLDVVGPPSGIPRRRPRPRAPLKRVTSRGTDILEPDGLQRDSRLLLPIPRLPVGPVLLRVPLGEAWSLPAGTDVEV